MKQRRFAEGTSVPAEKSRMEIENLVLKAGATGFSSAFAGERARIQFQLHDRMIRFDLKLPTLESFKKHPKSTYRTIPDARARDQMIAEHRRLWRALLLGLKAKLELSNSGIETFERVFLSNIVLPDGSTVADQALPAIEEMYRTKQIMPLLLGDGQ